jgi:5-methylcytosine-specific restriction endonuclease McrA
MPAPGPRAAAKAAGEKWYFTGKPCINGHISDRLTSDGNCRQCGLEKHNARYAANAEAGRQRAAIYKANNSEAISERARLRRLENIEEFRSRELNWRKANPEKVQEKQHRRYWSDPERERARSAKYSRVAASRRRQRAKENGGTFTRADILFLYASQRGGCVACKRALLLDYHIDHIIPLVRGGRNSKDNIQLLCPPCNMEKSGKDPIDFMRHKGFLL